MKYCSGQTVSLFPILRRKEKCFRLLWKQIAFELFSQSFTAFAFKAQPFPCNETVSVRPCRILNVKENPENESLNTFRATSNTSR